MLERRKFQLLLIKILILNYTYITYLPLAMREVREDMDLGTLNECSGVAKGIDAKFRIAKLLDLEINSVNIFKQKISGTY